MSDTGAESIGGKPSQAEGEDPDRMPEQPEQTATGHPSQAEGEDPDKDEDSPSSGG
ncbi:hypothetical protein [Microbacterium sp. CPCC 204701]|uniref:hypothetical protein n=1 Tax=Microbacterium sp. CPCC 204701 TaxID=2493084 RepID=UPI0013E351D0|nr:hypothetical protein [Microbacterium sp. CPCC 204701]